MLNPSVKAYALSRLTNSLTTNGMSREERMVEDWIIAASKHPINRSTEDSKQLYNLPLHGILFFVQVFTLLLLLFIFSTKISSGINLRTLGIANFPVTTKMRRERTTSRTPSKVSPRPSAFLEKSNYQLLIINY